MRRVRQTWKTYGTLSGRVDRLSQEVRPSETKKRDDHDQELTELIVEIFKNNVMAWDDESEACIIPYRRCY